MRRFTRLLLPALPAILLGLLLREARAGERGIRYALLVGCSNYRKAEFKTLPYTDKDVLAFRDALLATGFTADHVTVLYDKAAKPRFVPYQAHILQELDFILDGMQAEDTLVVALSGHGLQYKNDAVSYFVPLDGKLGDKKTLIPLTGKGGLYDKIRGCKAKRKVLLVNACRNDPAVSLDFASSRVELADEDRAEVPEGIAAIYSCSAGQKSYYDPDRKMAIFFEHLSRAWKGEYTKDGPVTLDAVLAQVRDKTKTHAIQMEVRQVPVIQREFKGDWVITAAKVPVTKPPVKNPVASKPPVKDPMANKSPAVKPSVTEWPQGTPDPALVGEMKFVSIPKGTFWMGWNSWNKTSKQVTIDHDFQLAAYCVTQGQWEQVMGRNPSWFSHQGRGNEGDYLKKIPAAALRRFPVEMVSWDDVQEFIRRINEWEAGKGWHYRLPTEAEWEYACRNAAHTKEECSFEFYLLKGTNTLSRIDANIQNSQVGKDGTLGLSRTTKVGSYPPNKLGLYDMHGNVKQWCEDAVEGDHRVIRGSSWNDITGRYAGTANRSTFERSRGSMFIGFRLARDRVEGK